MKHLFSLLLALAVCCAALTGCGGSAPENIDPAPDTGAVQTAENPPWEITGEIEDGEGWDTMPLSQLVDRCLSRDEELSEARGDALYRRFAG